MTSYEQEARRIISLLKDDFILPNGSLCLERVNRCNLQHHIFSDLGDFLPFFLYFGEKEFIDTQMVLYKNILQDGFLISEFPTWKIKNLVKSYEYTDLLFGLIDYYNFEKKDGSRCLLMTSVAKAREAFLFRHKTRSSFFIPSIKYHLPIVDSRDGTLIECLLDIYKETGDESFLLDAKSIYYNLVQNPFYIKYKIFSDYTFGSNSSFIQWFLSCFSEKFKSGHLCKNTTNTLFAFLSLYKETKDDIILESINQTVRVINEKVSKGGIFSIFDPNTKDKKYPKDCNLTSSFAVLDFLCDLYEYTKDEINLKFAKEIAGYWIAKQGRTGLFPLWSGGKNSFLDSETDMAIALMKLYELTNDDVYKKSADRCFDGIINFHGVNDYVLEVDIDSGLVVNSGQRTKFLALFLKLLILKIEYSKGEKIFSNQRLYSLLRDR